MIDRFKLVTSNKDSLFNQLNIMLSQSEAVEVVEYNAELHKVIAKLRTENNELYEESAKDKGL